tara:strand:+ start:92 stop:379 length:288 start_codon:yes stop_codon:yes gene_type:complete
MGSIQTGNAEVLTFNGSALAFAYTNAQVLILSTQDNDAYISYSEGGLQLNQTRWKIKKAPDGEILILPIPLLASGMLYFASANASATARISLWQM